MAKCSIHGWYDGGFLDATFCPKCMRELERDKERARAEGDARWEREQAEQACEEDPWARQLRLEREAKERGEREAEERRVAALTPEEKLRLDAAKAAEQSRARLFDFALYSVIGSLCLGFVGALILPNFWGGPWHGVAAGVLVALAISGIWVRFDLA